jgi:hypothetical protein
MSIVQHRPAGGCSLLIAGLIFAIVGGCVIFFLGSDTTLTCQRSTDSCMLEKTSFLGRKEVVAKFPLSRLKSAEVESKKGGRRKSGSSHNKPTYLVVLRTDDGTIHFSDVWTGNHETHRKTASDINSFLASSEESLSVVESGKNVRLFGWLFLAVGGLAFLRGFRGIFRMFRTLGFAFPVRG